MKEQIGQKMPGCAIGTIIPSSTDGQTQGWCLRIIFDCGYDDFFFEVNQAFHQKLLERGVMHDFIVRPGAHTGEYWSNSIDYQILFFLKFFRASH